MIPFKLVISIIILFVFLDKALTFTNLSLVKNNFPNVDALKIEKNPIARWFFGSFGLIGGSITYFIITSLTTIIAYILLSKWLGQNVSLYIIFILYSVVIGNNLFFLLKYAKVIP